MSLTPYHNLPNETLFLENQPEKMKLELPPHHRTSHRPPSQIIQHLTSLVSHYTFRMLALAEPYVNFKQCLKNQQDSERNNAVGHDAGIYAPFCSPLRHAKPRCSPGAPTLWTGAYCRSGKWSRQFWGGFCAHSVQNSCIHIK